MKGIQVKILTPTSNIILDDIVSVVIPGYDGEYCIQYNHLPMAVYTVTGTVKATDGTGTKKIDISDSGFAYVAENKVCIFADHIASELQ